MSTQVPDHTLSRCDVSHDGEALLIWMDSLKTKCGGSPGYAVRLLRIPGSKCCPVRAWKRYISTTNVPPLGPAFIHLDGRPLLDVSPLWAIRSVLTLNNHAIPHLMSLHSLWRGSTQSSASAGVSVEVVRDVRYCRSQSIFAYSPKKVFSEAPQALASLFG